MTRTDADRAVAFLGLGSMGTPMARRLGAAGYRVTGHDPAPGAAARLDGAPGVTFAASAEAAVDGAAVVVLMLPDSAVVTSVLLDGGLLDRLPSGTLLVDMGSSQPERTRDLAARAARGGVRLVDAPVSGGVTGAEAGMLTVMAGGDHADWERALPLLRVLGSRVLHVGPPGAGHALKALNNLMSATHLLVTSEAMLAGGRFGIDPAVMLDAVNGSSGRSGSTEQKWPRFVLPGGFDSGFALRLMVKDMRTATELAASTGGAAPLGEAALELWESAAADLPPTADHTEIVRWLERRHRPAPDTPALSPEKRRGDIP
ncbi:NAD(P)-dependent oxidoreductase [Streptomyces tagetis]|uniref:NAD(P)-dependent oxidoreductase n=1 Tax=Streptomyces tagetis TaxID=2820809 RepID=A0A940XAF5_9ACTN|nr:NAD(P)-dependent oxidoreductase [Streptomyces sp. RG38]MBQ0826548.1 NAD(P)-dependent oxidoreductase [Streptomyces sp. RG38]